MEILPEINEEEKKHREKNDVSLRSYQNQLLDIAERQNSIIFLPTGSGKTFIAIWIIKSRSYELQKPYGEGGKRTFYVVNTKSLVDQQASVIESMTNLKVGRYTGDINVDYWSKQKWLLELKSYQVMVMTAQILVNMLGAKYITLGDINVIVIDECHHAVNDHPFRQTMKLFENVPKFSQPLVIGLSATLINGNLIKKKVLDGGLTLRANVEKTVRELETTIQGTVAAASELVEVIQFSTCPKEIMISCDSVYQDEVFHQVMNVYEEAIKFVSDIVFPSDEDNAEILPPEGCEPMKAIHGLGKRVKNSLEDVKIHLTLLGTFGGAVAALHHIIQFSKLRMVSNNETESELLSYVIVTLNKARRILMKQLPDEENYHVIEQNSSPKVKKLLKIFSDRKNLYKENPKELASIIFVDRRVTAIVLCHILKILSQDEEFDFISPDFMVGGQGNPLSDNRECFLDQMRSEEIINKFRSGAINVLVATDVIEEGIDLPWCNLVIKFDKPRDYRSYVQSKGRARNKISEYFMLVNAKEYANFCDKVEIHQQTEECLKQLLIGRAEDRELPSEETIQNDLYHSDVRPYYVNGPNSACVTGDSAIGCVERYCQKLPQDYYSLLSPFVWVKKVHGRRVGVVQLPIACPLRENIVGEPKSNNKLAKRSVFVKVVQKLHELGELTDDLTPKKRIINEEDFKDLFPHYVNEKIPKDEPQPGTKQRTQTYNVWSAACLSRCLPKPEVALYLHVMVTNPVYPRPAEHRLMTIHDLLADSSGYAILSTKPLDEIFGFPILLKYGQVNCRLLVNASKVFLNAQEIEEVKKFHFIIFNKLLKIVKESSIFDNSNEEKSFFVVPVNKDVKGVYKIDWNVVRHLSFFPNIKELKMEERSKMVINKEKYNLTVVVPTYRFEKTAYLVTDVCKDMTPMTKFPGDYDSYYAYYEGKYRISIAQKDQPLLEVKALTSGLNFIKPRMGARKSQEEGDNYNEHLVPELCTHFKFPAGLWLKATLLPTMLYRIMQIYAIDEFRKQISRETGLGFVDLPNNASWTDLTIDKSCLKEKENKTYFDQVATYARPTLQQQKTCSTSIVQTKSREFNNDELPMDIDRRMNEVTPEDLRKYINFVDKSLNATSGETCRISPPRVDSGEAEDYDPAVIRSSAVELDLIKPKGRNFGPELSDMYHVFATSKANDICSFERLETLGDSFLKFATAVFLFREYDFDEGKLVMLKSKIVGNKNLMYCARQKTFSPLIMVNDFSPKSEWNPPLFRIPKQLQQGIISNNSELSSIFKFNAPESEQFSGNISANSIKEIEGIIESAGREKRGSTMELLLSRKTIPDKTVADSTEALIGVYLKYFGISGAFDILRWLGVEPKASYKSLIAEPVRNAFLPGNHDEKDVFFHLNRVNYQQLEKTLGYTFKEKSFLLEALTHSSYVKNRLTYNYQRLEFLGDAILDFLVTCYIYENCGDLTPGKLTDLRSSLVNNVTFACLSVRYKFHQYLLSLSSSMMDPIDRFVRYQNGRKHEVDEAALILLDETDCHISEAVEVPKVLGDLFESLAAAVFLDSGNSLETVWSIFYPLMKKEIDLFSANTPIQPVRLLYEVLKKKPESEVRECPDKSSVMVTFEVWLNSERLLFHGVGSNKQLAKRTAAKHALKYIQQSKKAN